MNEITSVAETLTTRIVMMVPSPERLRWEDSELVWVTWWLGSRDPARRELKLKATILDCVPGDNPTKPLRQALKKVARRDICSQASV